MASAGKPRNGGNWTESRFQSFIKSALRSASKKWGPRNEALKQARIRRGVYLCAGYERGPHEVPASLPPKPGNKRRRKVAVDHIDPVIDPAVGFLSWDEVIKRMFCEADGFQILCPDCHEHKTADERAVRTEQRRRNN